MKKIVIMAGTRPEAIKLAPVARKFREHPEQFTTVLCSTGQHREMLAQAFQDFEISPDIDLALMQPGQTLAELSGRLFAAVDAMLAEEQPDWIMVQGDTTTVMIASLCAFYRKIKVAHVEAGLRSFNRFSPFPEEINRRVAGLVVDHHFPPTILAGKNLIKEGVPAENITVTGNTVVDALLWMAAKVKQSPPSLPQPLEHVVARKHPFVLITGHRRESFGTGFEDICLAIRDLAGIFPQVSFVYPVHLNPNVRAPVMEILGKIPGVLLTEPLPYKPFVRLMDACTLILTDSGGIQEEGPGLGKPVLVMRELTERPEGVEAGTSLLLGTDRQKIVGEVSRLLTDQAAYQRVAKIKNPYGDGNACEKIFRAMSAVCQPG